MSASSIGRVWLIAGPTASGKSALAERLAEAIGGELVNADSLQIYRDLRCLSARPTEAQEAKLPHHLYGVADAADGWSVGRWLASAKTCLAGIAERGATAVVVGGTGLYFHALTHGLADIPSIPASVRLESRDTYRELGEAAFRDRLRGRDPRSAQTIAPNDGLRLMRAWEVVEATGQPIGAWRASTEPTLQKGSYQAVRLDPERIELYARCDTRMLAMIEAGALEETARLIGLRLDPLTPALKALGLGPLSRHLSGELGLEAAVSLAQQETRRYAKRQATWFRHQTPTWPRIVSLDPEAQWRELSARTNGPDDGQGAPP